ncbi:alanine/glycine:cation symporter family protein [Natranaerobius trueperi]|uniref:Sodium:alanine symporter family protein n=1 Tax=Natranaerobius trueperi TaxID=759412 RepID=A0A226C3J0_9FIRM|nr:alanine/glycine:cation symporter family protein [Natranaerobius trueperi]OWZ85039.1 sodium:alanine symporter family protein [Natranaerobius trueperi]
MEFLENIVGIGNDLLWTYVVVILLIVFGVYFSVYLNFPQIRLIGDMGKLLVRGRTLPDGKTDGISSFQALTMSIASHVGTGNMAGVAIAISAGGPGAVFWMWIIALVAASLSFVENILAQTYKEKDGNSFRGGPSYYMKKALGQEKIGIFFSVLITVSFGLIFNSVQANTLADAIEGTYGFGNAIVGGAVALIVALVIFGGVKRIARVTEILVPIMAVIYVGIAFVVILLNITAVPQLFGSIFAGAFGFEPFAGGTLGAVIMNGIRRGLFSNEAGMGSAPNAAATSHVSHPVKQALIQVLGVFVDTLIICTSTAFIILLSGEFGGDLVGIQLTQGALSSHVGDWGGTFITFAIVFFTFSSILGNYYYGETNIQYLSSNKAWLTLFRFAVLAMVFIGSIASLGLVWDTADIFMGLMVVVNVLVIGKLSKIALVVSKDYIRQKKEGLDPVFVASKVDGVENVECWDDPSKENK